MAEDRFTLTRAGYENLQRELQDLEARREQQLAALAEFDYTDLDTGREEAAYDATRETKEDIEQRIGHLKLVLENADVVDEDPDPERINAGDRAVVWDYNQRELLKFDLRGGEEIVYGHERGVALDSPVGKALLGRRVGDVIEVDVPDGRARYVIRKIERIP
jgi:transcription elongation factor GreA